jgi:hypothetical protein
VLAGGHQLICAEHAREVRDVLHRTGCSWPGCSAACLTP